MKPAVIFDFDGTIADSLPAVIQVFEELTKQPEKFTAHQIERLRDLSVPELTRELNVPKWKVPLLLLRGRKMIRGHLKGIRLHYGMTETIQKLHGGGIPLYVLSSNSTENVQDYLTRHELRQYFQGVYGGASLLGKAPRLLKLINQEKIRLTGSWYVGDELRDISAAKAVGLKSIAVGWGYNTPAALATKQPDALVKTAAELGETLEKAWKK